uniref:Secreted protein n=1 Tax=Ascaris lumbricoides TaxID=6252 RepID=A0A0M3IQI3_ASCLU
MKANAICLLKFSFEFCERFFDDSDTLLPLHIQQSRRTTRGLTIFVVPLHLRYDHDVASIANALRPGRQATPPTHHYRCCRDCPVSCSACRDNHNFDEVEVGCNSTSLVERSTDSR